MQSKVVYLRANVRAVVIHTQVADWEGHRPLEQEDHAAVCMCTAVAICNKLL